MIGLLPKSQLTEFFFFKFKNLIFEYRNNNNKKSLSSF